MNAIRQFYSCFIFLLAIYFCFIIYTIWLMPADIGRILFSEQGPFEVFTSWLWLILSLFCLINKELLLTTRFATGLSALLLAAREMDFHKSLFGSSFIKTNFYRSQEIPFSDKVYGLIILVLIAGLTLFLLKKLLQTLRLSAHHYTPSTVIILVAIFLTVISKILDRFSSQMYELFHIEISQNTSLLIYALEESTEMLIPILLIISLFNFKRLP